MRAIDKVRRAQPAVTIYQYPGTEHGFNCDDRRFYEPKSAAAARAARCRSFRTMSGNR